MSEDGGAAPLPHIVDAGVLTAVARADADVTGFVMDRDAEGQPTIIPVMALAAASLDMRSDDASDALRGLERLENVMIAPLQGADQAIGLAAVIARTGLDPWDAHVAAVAQASVCPILTLDAVKWRQPSADLDEPLFVVEIADPDEG